jgi:peptidoglycan/LPS O-acetylase OafA/YrhL
MDAPKAPRARFYRPELDVVRFFAFLFVFLHHTLPTTDQPHVAYIMGRLGPGLNAIKGVSELGLHLFFTLSAFLICELLLIERESTGKIAVKQFYIRRILRIWPLYYFALALGLIVALLPGSPPESLTKLGWYALFLGAWYNTVHLPFFLPVDPLWSISVEEQFYLFAPWVIKRFNTKSLYWFCAAIVLSANLWLYFLGREVVLKRYVWYNSFVLFECFAGGILLSLVLRGRSPKIAPWARLALIGISLSCWLYACSGLHVYPGSPDDLSPGSWHLIGGYALITIGAVLLLVAALGVNPKLLPGFAIYFGRISFGLYVYHAFALYIAHRLLAGPLSTLHIPLIYGPRGPRWIVQTGLGFGLTILMASLSYRYLETPFLKMKKRHAVIDSQPISGA